MVTVDNIAAKLCSIIRLQDGQVETREWRVLGQEQDGTLLFSWIQRTSDSEEQTCIGLYTYTNNALRKIHTFEKVIIIIQASINISRTLFGYVIKETLKTDGCDAVIYKPVIVKLGSNEENVECDLQLQKSAQIMVQFLYRKQSVLTEKQPDKFLVLIHQEAVLQYQISSLADFHLSNFTIERLVHIFLWAQWDSVHQTLYYIHYRKPTKALVEDEEETKSTLNNKSSPTLSGLQFHDDMPHETVMNIPLNLPHLPTLSDSCWVYEDDTLPLRIHNCSLDLIVLSDSEGVVCICHYYLYQPVQPATNLGENDTTPVHFAYSVTVLHQSCVIHCVIPGIPWNRAKTIRPVFSLHADHHMLVFIPGVCVHLLDVGVLHETACHITTSMDLLKLEASQLNLAPLLSFGKSTVLNLTNLDVIDLNVSNDQLINSFKANTSQENRLSILHYFLVHKSEISIAVDLITSQVEKCTSPGLSQFLKEFLIGSSYVTAKRNLPSDTSQLINLLPITTQPTGCDVEIKLNNHAISLSQDALWNASMMLLSPQQRLVPYRVDIWTKLWDHLVKIVKGKKKFKPSQVVEKLLVSLVCYQPEALSRCSTPLSPSVSAGSNTVINDLATIASRKTHIDSLPFYEIESCTASKQEHIISVNLRELSMHLLKQGMENKASCFQWQSQTPLHVHAVATRYVAAQLEQSRFLCHVLCKVVLFDSRYEQEKGFAFIDQLSDEKRYVLFTLLERYYLAVESIAFPLPQGFTSFFTFLGYRTLRFDTFLQYVRRNVFELQVDVMKTIMTDTEDSKVGVGRKLKLLALLPRSRAKRLLSQWNHPISLMVRAREHSLNILSGVEGSNLRVHNLQKSRTYQLGLAAFPSEDRLSPLDTFLDLLTAKANLTELDFGLLIEATVTSINNFW